jgi:hypothetical protein
VNISCGFRFTVNSDITVTSLGAFDRLANGLEQAVDVGLFALDGTLLISATVPSGAVAPLTDSYRYVDSADVDLAAGADYVISVFNFPGFTPTHGVVPSLLFAPAITPVEGRSSTGFDLTFPSGVSGHLFLGGNFQYIAAAIPEPTTLSLLGAALASFTLRRRRRCWLK